MKKPLNSITIFFACATSIFVNASNAQSPSTHSNTRPTYAGLYRYTGGWNASAPQNSDSKNQNQNSRPAADHSTVVQAAFYQAPGSGMNLPAFPGSDSLPGRLNDVEIPNNMPPQYYPPNNQLVTPPLQQPQFDPYASEQRQVFPPNQMQSPYRTASTDLRAVQNNYQQNNSQQNPAQQNPGNDLRPVAPTMHRGFGAAAQQIDVASGYPFVSPAPRTGNYPTSQYNGSLFRPVSYQNVVQSPQAPLSAAVANTQPTLPQFQNPAAGVYPTQYQCTPGAPTYPPPGAVPGTYVPPTLTPNLTPGTYSPNNSGYSPFFSLGQENYNVQIGRGIIGQPTVYVPGQPFRNLIRYLSP